MSKKTLIGELFLKKSTCLLLRIKRKPAALRFLLITLQSCFPQNTGAQIRMQITICWFIDVHPIFQNNRLNRLLRKDADKSSRTIKPYRHSNIPYLIISRRVQVQVIAIKATQSQVSKLGHDGPNRQRVRSQKQQAYPSRSKSL
jgi:hypothetical protein